METSSLNLEPDLRKKQTESEKICILISNLKKQKKNSRFKT